MNLTGVAHLFDVVIMAGVKRRPLRLPKVRGAVRVREPFEERNTGASSSRRGRGLPCCSRRGHESADDLTATSARMLPPLLPAQFWPYQSSRLLPRLTDP
jgi:hypothetical protein